METYYVTFVLLTVSSVLSVTNSELIVKKLGFNESLTELDSKNEKIFGLEWLFSKENSSSVCDERCGMPYNEKTSRIIGGSETTPNQYPWMVFLEITSAIPLQRVKSRCGGTLIKDRYVLTAAHCLSFNKIEMIQVFIGHHYIDTTKFEKTGHEIIVPVIQVVVHKDFEPYTVQNDLAILELAFPVQFTDQVHSICLSQSAPAINGIDAVVAGWGSTQKFGTFFTPQLLLHATVPLVDSKQCRKTLSIYKNMITSKNICAGGKSSKACLGDSGGPLLTASDLTGKSKRYTQIGVTSWGLGCEEEGKPEVYATIWNQYSWIQAATPKNKCSPIAPRST